MKVVIANRREGGWWWRGPVLSVLWLVIAAPIVVALIAASTLRTWAKDLPAVPDLASWRALAPQTSLLLAADGSHLAEQPFRDGIVVGHRTLSTLEQMPTHLVQAVLAAEDVRFFSHPGYDTQAIVRAAWIQYQGGARQGASTITQQLARNLLPIEIGNELTFRRKTRELLLARQIERRWSKREILSTYVDFVFLGQGAYGMVAGARAFFDREVGAIDLPQAALLAGLIQAPSRLDPFKHPTEAKNRRDEILARMFRAQLIDAATQVEAMAAPLTLRRPSPSYGTLVPWYTEQVRAFIASALPEDHQRGGLVVETAALPALGGELQQTALEHANRWGKAQVAAVLWDHRTGYIEALVGGRAWGPDRFDRMLLSCRQPGSAWKPLVYGAALASGAITPGTALRDAPIAEYDEVTNVHWKPKSGNRFRGVVLAQDAIAASLNAPAIDVFDRTGVDSVIRLARRLGITSDLAEVRPMALGASCVKPLELARVFAVIARRGWAVAPRFAVRIRRGDDVLFDGAVPEDPWIDPARRFDRFAATAGAEPDERVSASGGQLIDEPTAFQLQDMLAAVVSRGTATAARSIGRPTAGKTGTTNDNTDAWFVGFSGRMTSAVWLGFDDPAHKLGREGDGRRAALPLWMRAIRSAEGTSPDVAIPGSPPAGMERVTIDRETGLLAAPGASGLAVWFRTGTAPTEVSGRPGTSPTEFGHSTREF
ncbi:MAG: transglycosylase domain-containing protein [Deltaproteobacteria bacterium]|nr:transglycosylase domain-containing protein [Deltaproteobacteria bacterium]